jgi:predicted PurR-regulated permease PerM
MSTRRYIGIGLSVAILTIIGYYFSDVITWLSLGWIISMLGSPLMNLLGKIRLGQRQLPASVRAFMVLSLFLGILGFLISIIVPVVVQQGRNLAGVNYAAIMEGLDEPLSRTSDWLIQRGMMEGQLSKYSTGEAKAKPTPKPSKPTKNSKDSSRIVEPTLSVDTNNLTYIPADTVNIVVQASDSTKNTSNSTIYTNANISLDSLLYYDSLSGQYAARNVQFNIKVAMQGLPTWNELHPTIVPQDTTAIEKPDDTPLEKVKKRIFSFINPSAVIGSTAGYIINFFGNFLILLTSVSFIAFFFLKDEQLFGRGIKAAIPDAYAERTDSALSEIRRLLTRYFGGIVLQVFVIAMFVSTCLWFLGIKNGILIGFFAAFLNIIPYIGPIIGGLFALLVTVSSNLDLDFYTEMMPLLGKVALVFIIMQALDNFVLQPIIFSNSVLAHPLEIFIVVIAGAKLGGITGMIVALPIYTVFRVIAATFLNEFKLVQQLTQHLKEPDMKPTVERELPPEDLQ